MVSTSRPSTWPASIRHELTSLPSTMTVHAPQSPTSHPSLAPVRLKVSRNSLSSVVSGATDAVRLSPLTLIVTVTMGLASRFLCLLALRLGQCKRAFQCAFGDHGDHVPPIAGGGA